MNTTPLVERDERTVAVENAGHRWACNFLICGLFIDLACRGIFRHEVNWDLLALAVVPGVIIGVYKARQKALPLSRRAAKKWAIIASLAGAVAGLIAFAIAFWFRN